MLIRLYFLSYLSFKHRGDKRISTGNILILNLFQAKGNKKFSMIKIKDLLCYLFIFDLGVKFWQFFLNIMLIIFKKSTVKFVVVFKIILYPRADEPNFYHELRFKVSLWVFCHQHSKALENKHDYYFGTMYVRKKITHIYTCLWALFFIKCQLQIFHT